VILAGTAKSAVEAMDPMILMTTLTFPTTKDVRNSPVYVFAFTHVVPTDEMSGDLAYLESHTVEAESTPADPSSAETSAEQPVGTIEEVDITKILAEPNVVGDTPEFSPVDFGPVTGSSGNAVDTETPGEGIASDSGGVLDSSSSTIDTAQLEAMMKEQEESAAEIGRLKTELMVMGQDIRRLMKERRQPSTDREMRDAHEQLQAKYKKTTEDRNRLSKAIELKDQEIAELKSEILNLKSRPAA